MQQSTNRPRRAPQRPTATEEEPEEKNGLKASGILALILLAFFSAVALTGVYLLGKNYSSSIGGSLTSAGLIGAIIMLGVTVAVLLPSPNSY